MNRSVSILAAVMISLFITGCTINQNNGIYNVLNHGVKNDSATMNTEAIQQVIDECNANGGGIVRFPAGDYFTGTIELKSNVTLELMNGCTIIGSPNIADYPDKPHDVKTRMNRMSEPKSLIFAFKKEHIGIIGEGAIFFNGDAEDFDEVTNIEKGKKIGKEGLNRPFGMRFIRCKHIKISGVSLSNSAYWMQRYFECSYVTVDNIKVEQPCRANADGLGIDGCDHVTISDCYINSADDALCFKTESMRGCRDITVNNCHLSSHCNGIKMGTGSLVGFKNITISNCVIAPKICDKHSPIVENYLSPVTANTISGISLEIVDGGTMENINVSNIVIDSVETPLFIKLGDAGRVPDSTFSKPDVGTIRNIVIQGITATRCGNIASSITGIPGHYVENVTISNIFIETNGGITKEEVAGPVPENIDHYPETFMFGTKLPASGLYLRHVKNITIENVGFSQRHPDERPLIVTDDVVGLVKSNVKGY